MRCQWQGQKKNVLTTQQWKSHSQRETSKESWCTINLEVHCEYQFESDSFSCWLQGKLQEEKLSVLSLDAYDRALGCDVINVRSKLTSHQQFASVPGRAQCIVSAIASS